MDTSEYLRYKQLSWSLILVAVLCLIWNEVVWKLKSYFTTQGKMPQNLYHLNKKYSIKRKIPCHTKNLKSIITYKIHHGKIKDSKNKAESLQIAFKNGLRVQR